MDSPKPRAALCAECGAPLPPAATVKLCSRCAAVVASPQTIDPAEAPAGQRTLAVDAPEPSVPTVKRPGRFGDYELIEEIARGGMGIVYRARQTRLNRTVALKMILSGQFASKQEVLRFRGEAESAANLRHPNIVAIYETGEQDGQHYFSMEYVQGRNLAEIAQNGPLHARRAAEYVRVTAEAIHYAHQQGVLHRDLKPSNILIDEHDQPRITDFGLAKRARDDFGLTVTGQLLGSPSFMPPEQALPKSGKVGPASDVYGIGAVLYHLLTGRPPFQADTVAGLLLQLRENDPVPPRVLNPGIPRDLDTICLKCLEKNPDKRYAAAGELAAELGRFLRDEPIQARPVRWTEKGWRWCRRKPVLASLVLLVHLVGAAGLSGMVWQWHRAQLSAAGERQERARAQAQAYASDMNLIVQTLEGNNLGRGLELLNRHRPPAEFAVGNQKSPIDLRGWEWRYLWKLSRSDELVTLGAHQHSVTAVAFSPLGDLLASGGFDGKVKFWRPREGRAVEEWDVHDPVRTLAFSPDGRWLAVLSTRRGCRLWDVAARREAAVFDIPASNYGGALAFSPKGDLLAANADPSHIQLWDLATGSLRATLQGHEAAVWGLAFAADGRTLYSGGSDRSVRVWDVATLSETDAFRRHDGWISSLALSPDESILATGSGDGSVVIHDLKNRQEQARLADHGMLVWGVAFSPDGRLLATCGADQRIRLWDTATWEAVHILKGHVNEVWTVAFSPDGRTLASSGKDETVKLWLAEPAPVPPTQLVLSSDSGFLSLSPEGRRFATYDGEAISVRDTRTFREVGRLSGTTPGAVIARLGVDGRRLYLGYATGEIRAIDIHTGREVDSFSGHEGLVTALAPAPDGRRLASAGSDGRIVVQNAITGEPIATLDAAAVDRIETLAFSPDDRWLASSTGPDDQILVWDLHTQALPLTLVGHKGLISGLAFSPDGALLASASWDGTARLWAIPSGRLLASLRAQLMGVNGLAFTPDGRRLAAGTGDGLVKLWKIENHQEVLTLDALGGVGNVAFLADDETLVSASPTAVQLWHAPGLDEIERAERRAFP